MRMVFGFVFLFHGLQKMFGLYGGTIPDFPELRFFAQFLETFGGTLIMIGLFTRPVAFLLSGEMAVAYFTQHQPRALLPIENVGELTVLFCFAYLYMSTQGAGIWSIDSVLFRDRNANRYS